LRPLLAREAIKTRDTAAGFAIANAADAGICLGLWGFPNPIVQAVAFHHAPGQAGGEGLCLPKLIHIADQLVHQRRAQSWPVTDSSGIEPQLLENLGMEARWPAWIAQLDLLDAQGCPT